jgi:lipid-A-disaccharide synthase
VGLLPGSRDSEVKRHLPLFLSAFDELRRHFPDAEARLFASSARPDGFYKGLLGGRRVAIVRDYDYRHRARLDVAFSSSGTATLENALLGLPMVVVYKMSWPTYAIARAIIKVPYISMANILAGRKLVPELIQHEASPKRIARAAVAMLENPRTLDALKHDLASLRRKLGSPGASARAAEGILAELASEKARPEALL